MISDSIVSADWAGFAGLMAAVLSLMAYLPYLRDTLLGTTKPHRATWLIWSVLSAISTASQFYSGATESLWFSAVQTAGTALVFLLSIRFGMGTYLGRTDLQTLGAASVGLALWYLTDNAGFALAISIGISAIGGVTTVIKTYRAPGTETLSCWCLNLIAAGLALTVVGDWNWVLIAYPLYLFCLYAAIIAALIAGRAKSEPLVLSRDWAVTQRA